MHGELIELFLLPVTLGDQLVIAEGGVVTLGVNDHSDGNIGLGPGQIVRMHAHGVHIGR